MVKDKDNGSGDKVWNNFKFVLSITGFRHTVIQFSLQTKE